MIHIGEVSKMIVTLMVLIALALLLSACGTTGQYNDHANTSQTSQASYTSQTSQTTPGDSNGECQNETPGNPSDVTTGESTSESEESKLEPEEGEDAVTNMIGEMSLDEKIGQLFIVGFEGTVPDNMLRELIQQKHIAGVILFKRNIHDFEQLVALNNSIKELNSSNKAPLFLSVDEEGGRISRMPDQVKKLPSAKSIGKINNDDLSYEFGSLLALQTKAFGFNMDFAPVLDILSNPQNTVIGDRAFETTPQIVEKIGLQVMNGIRDNGVIPVIKHFPGHGNTIVDSHVGLPVVDHEMERLEGFELVPFQSAIENQADAVMIAHILMTKIDPKNPATLSKIVITDILREQLGFDGVVITDDMTMGAIEKNYNIGDASIKSFLAGNDIIMVCHGHENQLEAIQAIKAAVDEGLITESRLDESVYRILKLKQRYHLSDQPLDKIDLDALNKSLDAFNKKFEAPPVK